MGKDVLVSVKGTQVIGEESDTVEVITSGTWHEKNGKQYLIYEETFEEIRETTKNTVKISPGMIEVTKRGVVESRMVYERGKKHVANYMTPMGLIVLGITTKELFVEAGRETLHAEVKYALEMNGQFVSDSSLEIHASVKGTEALHLTEE